MLQDLDITNLKADSKTNGLKIKPDLEREPLKVLFVYTNIDGFHYDNYHFGMATLVSVTKDLGHDCKVEILTKREHFADFKKTINEFQPDIVGFSSVSSQFIFVKDLAKIAKDFLPKYSALNDCIEGPLDPQARPWSKQNITT